MKRGEWEKEKIGSSKTLMMFLLENIHHSHSSPLSKILDGVWRMEEDEEEYLRQLNGTNSRMYPGVGGVNEKFPGGALPRLFT